MKEPIWLNGNGRVFLNDGEIGRLEYKIMVIPPDPQGEAGTARGHVWGSRDVIHQVFEARDGALLERSDTMERIKFFVTSMVDAEAEITVNGSPGRLS
jgi:hypothetical protein